MFDNPLIWIAVIWWLVSTFLRGSKKRRRPPMPAQEPLEAVEEPAIYNEEEAEAVPEGFAEQPEPAPDLLTAQPAPAPALRQRPRTLKDLAQMWQTLDVEFSGGEVAAEPEPEPPAPAPPEPVTVPAEPPPEFRRRRQHAPSAAPGRPPRIAPAVRLTAGLSARFTPLQEAIIYREIFDRPRSMRRSRSSR